MRYADCGKTLIAQPAVLHSKAATTVAKMPFERFVISQPIRTDLSTEDSGLSDFHLVFQKILKELFIPHPDENDQIFQANQPHVFTYWK